MAAPPPSVAAAADHAPELQARLADGFTGIWYRIAERETGRIKYGGGLATYPQQVAPMAIHVPSQAKTFFALMLDEGDGQISHAVSYYDHRTGEVARPRVWLQKQTDDAHDAPALAFDRQGRILLFANTHGEVRRSHIFRSAEPYGLDRFTELLRPSDPADYAAFGAIDDDGRPTVRFSYGNPWVLHGPDGQEIVLVYTRYVREEASGRRERNLFWTTSADGDRWETPRPLAQLSSGQYAVSWPKPGRRMLGVAFDHHPGGGPVDPPDRRTDLFYLETDDARRWRNAAGETLVEPGRWLTSPSNAALVYDAPEGELVYIKDIGYSGAGRPVILFVSSATHMPSGHRRTLRTAQWTGERWLVRDVMTTDHNYDHGSIVIEPDAWTIIGPFLDGPQAEATGGTIGVWRSPDEGASWTLVRHLPSVDARNDTYVRRPLDAHPQFWAFWANGNGVVPSAVDFFFADRDGNRYRLPRRFGAGAMHAKPEPVPAIPVGDSQ